MKEMKKTAVKNHPDNHAIPGLKAKRSSAGLGLYTEVAITKGTRIIEYIGHRIPVSSENTNRYIFNVNKKIDIDGSPRWNTARYANHSCRPNCEAVNDRGRIFIEAKRNIKPGEELTYDYGKDYFTSEYIQKGGCLCAKCQEKKAAKK